MIRKLFLLAAALLVVACTGFGGMASAPPQPSQQSPEAPVTSDAIDEHSVPRVERWGVYELDIATQAVKLIHATPTKLSYLRLNTAGSKFVFSHAVGGDANEREEIFVMGVDGRGLSRLTDNAHWDLYPVWSPDGSRIAFLSWRAQSLGIFLMSSDGGEPVELLDSPAQEADIDWVGNLIAFTRESRIWTVRPDGSGARPITDPPNAGQWGAANLPFGDYDPRISPDGSLVVFERLVGDESPHGNYDLFVADLGTLEERRLTTTGFSQGLASWSHSGGQLVYIVSAIDRVGKYDIYTINSDGTDSRSITPSYFPEQFLCHWAQFSPDDAAVYFIGEWWQ